MAAPGTVTLDAGGRIVAAGDWTLSSLPALGRGIDDTKRRKSAATEVDASGVSRLDTAGAELLLELAGDSRERITGLDAGRTALVDAVAKARSGEVAKSPPRPPGIVALLARTGRGVEMLWDNAYALVGFIGLMLVTIARVAPNPRRWRVTSLFFHIEQTGLDAVPIVALLSFLVGAVVAFLGATVLRDFGATVFTVELVGYSFLREFGVLLTAILIAGRSGSAFTAQLGSMKAREEIDAIRTLGLDPVEVLVLPRALALLVSMPLLTFIAMLAGIFGGALVCIFSLDISPGMFLQRFHDTAHVRHFWVGISKAPLFAFLIAAIGCLEGFKVSGSAESVGEHTTSSVVQSIFVVILIDALAAIFFMELDV
ncbi:MAG TPA: ABC transporter permease [Rhodanobacteraceae bacterium]|jgi:phospholipid/cholesterol/gamma-HCH transport system permease protein